MTLGCWHLVHRWRDLRLASHAAMLTAPVNIAVFAAFWFRVRSTIRLNAEFKPISAI
jgi:hypothetical protein